MSEIDILFEGCPCPKDCGGMLYYPLVENCSCHINPPCAACISVKLTCNECGEEFRKAEKSFYIYPWALPQREKPSHDLGSGKRIFDYSYDGRSGSTMVYQGRYEGDVSPQDIIKLFGDGTFGHRGPSMYNGRFTYTKITD